MFAAAAQQLLFRMRDEPEPLDGSREDVRTGSVYKHEAAVTCQRGPLREAW